MTVTIGLTGDVMIGRLVNDVLSRRNPESLWGDVLPLMQENDLNLINLEAALTTSDKIVPKVFNFKADPKKVAALVAGNVTVANLANNHILDYDVEGLLETLDTLDDAAILHVGAGRNILEARQPVIVERKGVTIGILGYTDNEPSWKARKEAPGTRYIEVGDLDSVEEDVRTIRDKVDIVIATLHWGPNMRERPAQPFVEFAHGMVDIGVNIVHGHSAHIFQGVESYNNGLILYDTGEFVDDYYVDPSLRNDRSFFFLVDVDKEGVRHLRLVPILISDFQVNRTDKEEQLERMELLSAEFGTALERRDGELHLFLR